MLLRRFSGKVERGDGMLFQLERSEKALMVRQPLSRDLKERRGARQVSGENIPGRTEQGKTLIWNVAGVHEKQDSIASQRQRS